MAAPQRLTFLLLSSLFLPSSEVQVFWYGDERAYLQPASSQGFFDLAYTEDGCPQGIESNAIPKYAYFGPMIATMYSNNHAQCLLECLRKKRCVAVNYFDSLPSQSEGYCELLSEGQLDNPRRMRPFRHSTYYENIKCPEDIIETVSNNDYGFTNFEPQEPSTTPKKPTPPSKNQLNKKTFKKLSDLNMDYRQRRK